MKIIKSSEKNSNHKKVISLAMGMFDGLHIGHTKLIERTVQISHEQKYEGYEGCGVYTFDVHPKTVFAPESSPQLITTNENKFKLFEKLGIDVVFIQNFNIEIASMEPFAFVKDILVEKIRPKNVVVGYNYTFGNKGSGNAELLSNMCRQYDINVEIVSPVSIEGITVSSTNVRDAIIKGNMTKANMLLGRNYQINGRFDFCRSEKTQNIDQVKFFVNFDNIVPCSGRYLVKIKPLNGDILNKKYFCIINDNIFNNKQVVISGDTDYLKKFCNLYESEILFLEKVS